MLNKTETLFHRKEARTDAVDRAGALSALLSAGVLVALFVAPVLVPDTGSDRTAPE